MQIFKNNDTDTDVLADLLEEIHELYEDSEQTLIELESSPQDNELQRALFRSVHTIKGDLGLVNFAPLLPLLQRVEDLLDMLRNSKIQYTSTMSDLVLLSMDRVKIFVEEYIQKNQAEYDDELLTLLEKQISKITPENNTDHEKLLHDCVLLLDPSLDSQIEPASQEAASPDSDSSEDETVTLNHLGFSGNISKEQQIDILFFRKLMEPVEERSRYWQGRCDRIAKLALLLNRVAGSPIDEIQLVVASYVHDFGMAFMPLSLLYKTGKLEQIEFNLLRSHVFKSAKLLEHLNQWNEARKIVMQHHERLDGSGYPMGLKANDICEGAKLLAIVDTFDALTHPRDHDSNRPVTKKRAVLEINKVPKGLLCPKWMDIFNKAMAKLLTR